MRKPLEILRDDAQVLGNHNKKYILAIETYLDTLKKRLEEKGKVDQVHLWHMTDNFEREMSIVLRSGTNKRENLNLLGCYYSLQYLHMNLLSINRLRLVSCANNVSIYKDFMLSIGTNFRKLTTAYICNLLEAFLPSKKTIEFFIASVGTRADQDDIDVGIVDEGSKNRRYLNSAISRIAREMLKFACSIHFHLSEHISKNSYCASIPEYNEVLNKQIRDFIIISEILGATRIVGSPELFNRFSKEISERYFYKKTNINTYNEGFLRGILGEVKSLIIRPLGKTKIHPKDDGLRIIKGIIAAKKTLFDIHETNNWDIIEKLKEKNPERENQYWQLDRALSFLEIFRYLYQLLVVQEEEIRIREPGVYNNISNVARFLGYVDIGTLKAPEHLLVHYYEYVNYLRNVVPALIADIENHLRTKSIFVDIFKQQKRKIPEEKNLAIKFVKNFRFFRGTTYWEDILDTLNSDTSLLHSFTKDLNSLSKNQKRTVLSRYIDWVNYDIYSLIRLLVIIEKSGTTNQTLFHLFNSMFLNSMKTSSQVTKRLANIFMCYRKLMYGYLSILDKEGLMSFKANLNDRYIERELAKERDKLRFLTDLLLKTSSYFKRFMDRAADMFPQSISYLSEPERLEEISKGILGEVRNMESVEAKKKALGDYYDIEFFRVAVETINGAAVQEINAAFSEFCDNYINMIFDVCKEEVENEHGKKVFTGDLLAIFAAGGHAREQAFNDDYDLIVLLDSRNGKIRELSMRVIALMNQEITKRGTIPHYRFADHFGNFVVLVDELETLFKEENEYSFIDKSQILGSRIVVGSEKFKRKFDKRIIYPYIFAKKKEYIMDMIKEIDSRQKQAKDDSLLSNDIKEGIGGLRDIEMLILIYKAKYEIKEPVNGKIFDKLKSLEPYHMREIDTLGKAFDYLKNLRNIYRLTVAANDSIDFSSLDARQKKIFKDFQKRRHSVNKTIKYLFKELF